jgi:hypothetical protein
VKVTIDYIDGIYSMREATGRQRSRLRSRQLGHFTLIQSDRGPERYGITHILRRHLQGRRGPPPLVACRPSVKLSE